VVPALLLALGVSRAEAAADDVLTQHNDTERTGAQLHETSLTPATVSATTFGRLYERHVDGQVIAQPLYAGGLAIPGKGVRNVVFVVTRRNVVYAFDADDTDPDPTHGLVWSHAVTVEPAGPVPGMCGETRGAVGITSTPVIDRVNNAMYLVARKADGTIWLHVLDITTGAPKAGTPGAVQIIANQGGLVFNQGLELNRAGLLLSNGAILFGFSALNCDNPGWHGWVLAYRASDLKQVGVFATTTQSGWGGGVWASGKGIVADGAGGIYFQTGNGAVLGTTNLGQSLVKLTLGPPPNYGLTFAGKYTVSNWAALNTGDTDLGSSGPLLLPGGRLVGGGKQGKLYVLDTATMQPTQNASAPGPVPPGGSDGFQAFINTWHNDATRRTCMAGGIVGMRCFMPHARYEESELAGPNLHSGPIYWNGRLYAMPEKDFIRAFDYNTGSKTLATTPAKVSTVRPPDGMPGAALSLSANGNSNGIIWALFPKADGQWENGPGRLVAFDATSLKELWRDDDDIAFAKFTPPMIAGGKVFRPTFADKLIVYGAKAGATPASCYNIAEVYQNYTSADGVLGAATGPETALPDGIGRRRDFAGGSIVWTAATCGHEVHGAIVGEWNALGSWQGILGYPLTNETSASDSIGRFNHFQKGSIWWTNDTGAHEVHGAIGDKWVSLGAEQSALGYPVTDETDEVDGSGRFSLFQHGAIHWRASDGTITVNAAPDTLLGPQQAATDRSGSDLTHFDLPQPNPSMCEERCQHEGACKAWTYMAPNTTQGPAPRCWLKTAVPLAQANNCCVSGLKVPIQPAGYDPMQGAFDRLGSDFASFDVPTPEPLLCQGECAGNSKCVAWAFVQAPKPHCWLKDVIPAAVPNTGVTAGARSAGPVATIGDVWEFTGTACNGDACPGWRRLDHNPKTIALAANDSSLYQLHHDGWIWRYTGPPCNGEVCPGWQRLDNNAKTVAIVAGGSDLYQLHDDGWIWRYTGTPCNGEACPGWQRLDNNSKTVAIAAGGGDLYQLHDDGWIWRYTGAPCNGEICPGWQRLDNNSKTVAIATSAGDLYQLHDDGWIWRYTGTPCSGEVCPGWQRLDNNSKTVAIAAAGGALYQLHDDGWIWRYTGTPCNGEVCPGWQRLDDNPKGVAITAGGSALYQLHNDGWIWRYTGPPCTGDSCPGWSRLDNNTRTALIVAAGDKLYQLHTDPLYQRHASGWLWRYSGPTCSGEACPGWVRLDDNPATVAAVAAGRDLYQLHQDGAIWRSTGVPCNGDVCPGWQRLDHNPATTALAAAGRSLYQLHNDGSIWRSTGTPCNADSCPGWQRLDYNSATTAVAAAGRSLYQLHHDGSIWRSTGAPCNGNSCPGWQRLDNNPRAVAIAAAGRSLYQLHNDGTIWRSTGAPCNGESCPGWQRLDNNPKAVAIVAASRSLYQLHNDGTIWRSTGAPCNGESCPGWQALDNNPRTSAIAGAGRNLYQLHNDGTIWRSTGTACAGEVCAGWERLDDNNATRTILTGGVR
jgi:hypothetical protein